MGLSGMLRAGALLLAAVALNGCAGIVAGAAVTGYGTAVGFKPHVTSAEVSFVPTEVTPSESALAQIRSARTLAVYPVFSDDKATTVDTFRLITGMDVVPWERTLDWMEAQEVQLISKLRRAERAGHMAGFVKAMNADVAIFVESTGGHRKAGSALTFDQAIETPFRATMVNRSGEVLWIEDHVLSTTVGQNAPTVNELGAVQAKGLADRLMQLRTGRTIPTS